MSERVYRVQAGDGRGPWRPGFSKYWVDEDSTRPLPTDVLKAFGMAWKHQIPDGWHCGCACRTMEQLFVWFTPIEQRRLDAMGYSPVWMLVDKIVAENAEQVVFARKEPLNRGCILMPWEISEPMLASKGSA